MQDTTKVVNDCYNDHEYHLMNNGESTLCGIEMYERYERSEWEALNSKHLDFACCVACHNIYYHGGTHD
jgi:hypothetical protein